jgi:hypothetical protein
MHPYMNRGRRPALFGERRFDRVERPAPSRERYFDQVGRPTLSLP